jgi:hypothetical protein
MVWFFRALVLDEWCPLTAIQRLLLFVFPQRQLDGPWTKMQTFDYAIEAELFDYSVEAELFSAKGKNFRRQPLGYKRFARAADAICFAIEELPSHCLAGTYLEVNEERYQAKDIRRLYDSVEYPLARRVAAAPRNI